MPPPLPREDVDSIAWISTVSHGANVPTKAWVYECEYSNFVYESPCVHATPLSSQLCSQAQCSQVIMDAIHVAGSKVNERLDRTAQTMNASRIQTATTLDHRNIDRCALFAGHSPSDAGTSHSR